MSCLVRYKRKSWWSCFTVTCYRRPYDTLGDSDDEEGEFIDDAAAARVQHLPPGRLRALGLPRAFRAHTPPLFGPITVLANRILEDMTREQARVAQLNPPPQTIGSYLVYSQQALVAIVGYPPISEDLRLAIDILKKRWTSGVNCEWTRNEDLVIDWRKEDLTLLSLVTSIDETDAEDHI
jgi:hypothetical protein